MLNAHHTQTPRQFLALLLFAECILIGATWPLWSASGSFPVFPLVGWFRGIPVAADQWLALFFVAGNVFGAVGLLWPFASDRGLRWNQTGTLILGLLLVLLDQQRLQPWHWLYLLISLQVLLVISRRHLLALNQLTMASIYIFAGVSRLGPEVAEGMTRQLAAVALQNTGLIDWLRNENAMQRICILLVCGEILTGFALLLPVTRKIAVVAAVGMHAVLLMLLSPWGLNHHAGVVLWNVFLMFAVPILFLSAGAAPLPADVPAAASDDRTQRWRTAMLTGLIVVFPMSGLFGFADNWPSWQVYSPRADVVRLFVRERSVQTLPASLQPFVAAPTPLSDWCPIRIDRWALDVLQAPLYPEDRLQLAVVLAVCRDVLTDDVEVVLETAQPLFWRPRNVHTLRGVERIRRRAEQFRFNGIAVRE